MTVTERKFAIDGICTVIIISEECNRARNIYNTYFHLAGIYANNKKGVAAH